ncbi:MAG: flagellar hook-length control protein FliK, partial [Pseudomonadota bacterium]|nr:flagellar hook-length control protein FliK [Pseudomonadota bacterium]
MTTPLSSLLAAALNQTTGPTSPVSAALSSTDATTQGSSRGATPVIANAALSQATALDNAAKVIVERLPERVLSITMTSSNASSNLVPSVAQVLHVVLPAEVSAKLSKHAIHN